MRTLRAAYLGGHPDEPRLGNGALRLEGDRLVWEGKVWQRATLAGWTRPKRSRFEIDVADIVSAEALNNDDLRNAPTGAVLLPGLPVAVGFGSKRSHPVVGGWAKKLTNMLRLKMRDERGDEYDVVFGNPTDLIGSIPGSLSESYFTGLAAELVAARRSSKAT